MGITLTLEQLRPQLDSLRDTGKTIVTTNGCFDLLHVGHVRILKAARLLGDILVVGINSDLSVHQLKGNGRPIMPEEERAEIIASLCCVDYAIIFSESTPVEFLQVVKPHIHVKGGDYKISELAETKVVESSGGAVKIIDLVPEHSTTSIIQRITNLASL